MTSWRTAPTGWLPCYLCHRYKHPDKLEEGRCVDRRRCQAATVSMIGRPRKPTKKQLREWGWS